MEDEPIRRVHISQILNLGFDLRERLETVAAREGLDATGLGPPDRRGRRFGQGADRGSRRAGA